MLEWNKKENNQGIHSEWQWQFSNLSDWILNFVNCMLELNKKKNNQGIESKWLWPFSKVSE
jgi:hypothetical protein